MEQSNHTSKVYNENSYLSMKHIYSKPTKNYLSKKHIQHKLNTWQLTKNMFVFGW
jgi:hypothetical protein